MEKVLKISSVNGKINAVESKSDAHRALICAALCNAATDVKVTYSNNDIDATAACLKALGAYVERHGDVFTVTGRALGGGTLDCGESGSTVRFLIPVAAALGRETSFIGSGKLPTRPMLPLTERLREKGCDVSSDLLPITLSGKAKGGRYVLPGNVSSQFVSGLLMALPLTGEQSEIMMSSPLQSELYADMTVRTLQRFGVRWKKLSDSETEGFCGGYVLEGGKYASPEKYTVEGDWSGASFFVVAAALGGEITICGLDENSLQPDKAVAEIAKKAGAQVSFKDGALTVKKGELKPFSVDVSQFPDIFPILAVLACGAKGESLLYNAGRLRIKESDRIETTAKVITALGGKVETGEDYMKIFGTGRLACGTVEGAGDHRIVMSAAVAALLCEDEVIIKGSEAVNKSFPSFFEVLASL